MKKTETAWIDLSLFSHYHTWSDNVPQEAFKYLSTPFNDTKSYWTDFATSQMLEDGWTHSKTERFKSNEDGKLHIRYTFTREIETTLTREELLEQIHDAMWEYVRNKEASPIEDLASSYGFGTSGVAESCAVLLEHALRQLPSESDKNQNESVESILSEMDCIPKWSIEERPDWCIIRNIETDLLYIDEIGMYKFDYEDAIEILQRLNKHEADADAAPIISDDVVVDTKPKQPRYEHAMYDNTQGNKWGVLDTHTYEFVSNLIDGVVTFRTDTKAHAYAQQLNAQDAQS